MTDRKTGVTYHVQPRVVRHPIRSATTMFVVVAVCPRGRRTFVASYPTKPAAHEVADFFNRLQEVVEYE